VVILKRVFLCFILLSLLSFHGKISLAAGEDNQMSQSESAFPHTNRLIDARSPYLLQHAHNPVHWYEWGEEAFEAAKREDKPIFLSIGYSTCHWCHVMEKESFEDPEVAEILNKTFISIKVDREERPDLDGIYMTVCQMLTGSGGWPLTVFLTPERRPFFAGTYFPKESMQGRIGLMELALRVHEVWNSNRDTLLTDAGKITEALQQSIPADDGAALTSDSIHRAYRQLTDRYDPRHGGFGSAPKFPSPHNLLFLLRYWKRTADDDALEMVEKTLVEMRRGGIFDHIGLGFHRYSTDERWLLPHFEKMLYDQALLVMAYTEAWLATGKGFYKQVAEEIIEYVLRDMTHPEGGFYSAEDADSEGEEGRFYVWTTDELEEVLGQEEARLLMRVFSAEEQGNFREEATGQTTGANILHRTKADEQQAKILDLPVDVLRERVEAARLRLFDVREKRVHPFKDDKILTDWNGLMAAALAKAGRAFNEPGYLEAARKSALFIRENLTGSEATLQHRYREGKAGLDPVADDYAFQIWTWLELYEAEFQPGDLAEAVRLTEEMIKLFWDEKNGAFYLASSQAEDLIVRQKESYDGAIPSANSVAAWNLARLFRMTGRPDYQKKAERIGRVFAPSVNAAPSAHCMLLMGTDFWLGPTREVVISGSQGSEVIQEMIRVVQQGYFPHLVTLYRPEDTAASRQLVELVPYTENQTPVDGKATAYVCENFSCHEPVTDPGKMLELLAAE
jgi:uncharacterized protein